MYVNMHSGMKVCPRGYVLSVIPLSSGTTLRLGQCILCKSGTYSVDPLYVEHFEGKQGETDDDQMGITASPKCLTCPSGGTCLGGDKVFEKNHIMQT